MLMHLGLCWLRLSLITFSLNHLFIFFKHTIQNTSNVPIPVKTGSDNTAIKESERNVKQNLQEHSE